MPYWLCEKCETVYVEDREAVRCYLCGNKELSKYDQWENLRNEIKPLKPGVLRKQRLSMADY